jgi:hypothetical protein
MWANEAIFLISIAKALDLGKHPRLHTKLHSASNDGGNDLTEEHWAMWDLHVVGKLQVDNERNRLCHGNITPCLEQHHRNRAARKGVSNNQLRNDV